MRKVIPKIPKVKGLFKNLPWFNMIYLAVAGLLCLLVFFSNLGFAKYIAVLLIVAAAALSEIRKDDISYARTIWLILKGLTKPSIYVNEQINAHKNSHNDKKDKTIAKKEIGNITDVHGIREIRDNTIFFVSGVMVQLIEVPDITFVLKEEITQNKYQDALGKAFNIIAPFKNVTLMKTERKIDFSEFIANLEERIKHIKEIKRLTLQEKQARMHILEEKIKQFEQLEYSCKIPVYHLVIRGANMQELASVVNDIIGDFESVEMSAYVASSKNIGYAIMSQYQRVVDLTNVVEGIELAEAVLPSKIETRKNKVIVDDIPISTYAISGLPGSVGNAWLAELCSITDVNVTVNVCAANSRKLIRKIDRAYFTNGNEAESTSKLSESVAKSSQQCSMESLLEDLEYAQDKLCEIEILISFVNNNLAAEQEINK
ncbi:MAG: hypothetical protein RR348_01170, partial [Clostridia bacterium]